LPLALEKGSRDRKKKSSAGALWLWENVKNKKKIEKE
jgi:hypothetical protein